MKRSFCQPGQMGTFYNVLLATKSDFCDRGAFNFGYTAFYVLLWWAFGRVNQLLEDKQNVIAFEERF